MLAALTQIPYPSWLNPADNTWQLTAATFVGLMSLPGLAVLYASLVQKKWAVNVLAMSFAGFSLVLIGWFLWEYKMGFGPNSWGGGIKDVHGVATATQVGRGGWTQFIDNFWGKPGPFTSPQAEQGQAVSGANTLIPFHFPGTTLAYFQLVFAAITPLLFLGSVLGRIKFSAWVLLVPLWSTFVYTVNAFLLWGGGYFAQEGAVDFSGGYVIHMSAGVSGFVAAWVLGPRLLRDRQHAIPNNLVMAAVGAGILWLGWNGFNGGDPYYAGADAAAAVVNTNLATAAGVMTWIAMDAWLSKEKKPTFLGGVNGMICGLVGITPSAGWVNGYGALLVGVICTVVVWFAWNFLSKVKPFSVVDDALGVIYTHGMAGFLGGMLVGVLGDPGMIEYGCGAANSGTYSATSAGCVPFSVNGLVYTGSAHQLWEQFRAAVFVILWSAVITFLIMKVIGWVLRGARYKDEVLEVGDQMIHGEEAFPEETLAARVSSLTSVGSGASGEPLATVMTDEALPRPLGDGPPSGPTVH